MGPLVTCVLSPPNASRAARGLLSEALHKPGGGSLARAVGLPELAYGEGQGHELHREEVSNDKSEQSHYSFWTSRPSRVIARTPGNESWQATGTGHVDRRDVAARQRPHDPNVDAARGGRGGGRLRRPPKAVLHAEASRSPAARPTANVRRGGTEAPAHRTAQGRLRAAAPPSGVAGGWPEPGRAPAPALRPPAPRPARC